MKVKNYITIILVVLLYSCSSTNDIIKYPRWFSSNTIDSNRYYYGIGEGHAKNIAITNALNEIASKVSVTIESSTDTNTISSMDENNQKNYSKSVRRNITNKVKKIEFSEYEVAEYKKLSDKRHIVLVKVGRIKNAKLIIEKINTKIKDYESFLANKNTNVMQNIKKYSQIIKNIDTSLIPQYFIAKSLSNTDEHIISKMIKIKSKANKYKNDIVFYVSSKQNNKKIYTNSIIEYINKQGYIAKSGYKKNGLNIIVGFKEKKLKLIGNYIFKSKIILTIQSNNKIFDKRILNIGSKSNSNFDIAKEFAIKNLEKKLNLLSEYGVGE